MGDLFQDGLQPHQPPIRWSTILYPQVICWHSYWKWWKNGPVEIVDLPINSMVIFHSSVSLPEGTRTFQKLFFNSNPLAATPTGMSGTKCGWPWVSSQKITSRWIRFLVKNPCWWMVGEWLGYIYMHIYIYIIMSFFPPQTWIVMNSSYLTLISHSNFWRRIAIPDRTFLNPELDSSHLLTAEGTWWTRWSEV